jgi:tetratricopeptide (TPR) repeat protein
MSSIVEWVLLTDERFESLCYDVLARTGYRNLIWLGRSGGDRGRDIKCEKTYEIVPGHDRHMTCIAQCKRYLSRPPSISDLTLTIAWAEFHNPDILIIMVSNILSADTREWLNGISQQKRFHVSICDEKNFEGFFETNRDVYAKYFEREFPSPKNSVIGSLLDMECKTIGGISTEIGLIPDQVKSILDDLQSRKVVLLEEGGPSCYRLAPSMTTFVGVAHSLLLDERMKLKLLGSRYCKEIIRQGLLDYIQSRYHITLDGDRKTSLAQLFSISPSALSTALSAPTEIYDTGYADVQKMALEGEPLEKWNETMIAMFLSDLLPGVMTDLRGSGNVLKENQVEGYNINIGIKMANSKASLLDMECETTILYMPVKGPVKAGQLLFPTDPDLHILTGNILLNLKLFKQAILEYDKAISAVKDTKKLAMAYNNKGLCLWRLDKPEAIGCFERAQELDPSLIDARNNEEKCRVDLGSSGDQGRGAERNR